VTDADVDAGRPGAVTPFDWCRRPTPQENPYTVHHDLQQDDERLSASSAGRARWKRRAGGAGRAVLLSGGLARLHENKARADKVVVEGHRQLTPAGTWPSTSATLLVSE